MDFSVLIFARKTYQMTIHNLILDPSNVLSILISLPWLFSGVNNKEESSQPPSVPSDETLAAESLANYMRCNNSFVMEVFQVRKYWPRGLTMCYYANKAPRVHSWTTCHKELTTCFSSGPIPLLADVSHLPAAVQHFRPFPLRVAAHSAERDDAGVSGGPVHRSEPETGKKGWKPRG